MRIVLTLSELVEMCDWAKDQFTSLSKAEGPDFYGGMGEVEVVIEDEVSLVDIELGTISTRPRSYFKEGD